MRMKLCCCIACFFIFLSPSFSQQKEFELINYTQENGLPSNETYFVYRDSRDFLWIATDQGVVRYNGNKMERFELPDNVIFKIYEDSKGRIWFFSHTGKLSYFYKEAVHPYQYNDNIAKAFKMIIISNAYVNDSDEIILNAAMFNAKISKEGMTEKIIYQTDRKGDSTTFTVTPTYRQQYFTQMTSYAYFNFDSAYIKLAANGRSILFKVPFDQPESPQYGCKTVNGKDFFFFFGKMLIKLSVDGSYKTKYFASTIDYLEMDKNIWIGLKKGTALLDTGLNIIYRDERLKDMSVTSIRNDHEGGTWFSTLEKGIFYLKNSHVSHLTADSALLQPVFRFAIMADNSLLFANSKGVYKMSGGMVASIFFQTWNKITDLFIDSSKNIYVAGNYIFARCPTGEIKDAANRSFNNIITIGSVSELVRIAGNKLLANTYDGLRLFDVGDLTKHRKIPECIIPYWWDTSIVVPGILFRDMKSRFWVGSINTLCEFDSVNSRPLQFKLHDSLFRKGVTCMRQLENGIYSIGIRFGGIALMQDTTVIGIITENDGLLSNSTRYLLPLKDQLWAATAKGISIINFQSYSPLKYRITNIGKNAGLYNITINQLILYGNKVIAATSNGIYEIDDPEMFLNSSPQSIPFYINSISYYKGDTSDISKVILPYKNNRVVIRYSAICFNSPDELRYFYRFDKTDTTWHSIASTELLLENLIPGTYNLEMKAVIPSLQRFSDIKRLQIIVEKPWWQNNWLKLLAFLCLAGAIYILYKRRIHIITRREQQSAALKTKMMELEQTALRSQMNPHFIFNCLTSIQQLIVTGNKIEANEYLVRFARLIRKTLALSRRPFITIAEEVNYLNEYIVMEQLRIPGKFDFDVAVDGNIDVGKTEIPNMMLQPIVENCIRHGIKHLHDKKGHIHISFQQKEHYIYCSISDNGIGRSGAEGTALDMHSDHKSYGMDIVKRRLKALSDPENTSTIFEVTDLLNADGSAAGTKVTLQLPFK